MKKAKKIIVTLIICAIISISIICVLNYLWNDEKLNTETQENPYNVSGNYYVGSYGINPERKGGAEFLKFLDDGAVEIVYCGWKSDIKYKTYASYSQNGRKIEITYTNKSDKVIETNTFILISSKDGEKLYIENDTYSKVDDMSKEDKEVLELFE